MSEPKLYRYYLPSENGEGWAEIVVCSTGFFGAVSDWGDYANAWRHHGCADFRTFLLNAERSPEYFAEKLVHGAQEYDAEATMRGLKQTILGCRRERTWTREEARCEWDNLIECGWLSELPDFHDWLAARVRLRDAGGPVPDWDDVYAEARHRIPAQAIAFVTKTMPRLCALIRAELAAERKEVA